MEETGKGGIRCHRLFMVHWFQLGLPQWSQALFGLLVAGLFSVMITLEVPQAKFGIYATRCCNFGPTSGTLQLCFDPSAYIEIYSREM